MIDGEAESFQERMAAWASRGGSPETTAAAGEVWYVSNTALGVENADTTEHPALIVSVSGGVVRASPGTSDPQHYPKGLVLKPRDLIVVDGDAGLGKTTYFSPLSMPLIGNDLKAIRRRLGAAPPAAMAELDRLRQAALGCRMREPGIDT